MTTFTKDLNQESVNAYEKRTAGSMTLGQRYDRFIEGLRFSHFGLIAAAILIGSCLGSITAMFIFYNGAPIWVFAIGLFASMANLVACIGQAPTRWVLNIFLASLLVNLLLIVFYPVF